MSYPLLQISNLVGLMNKIKQSYAILGGKDPTNARGYEKQGKHITSKVNKTSTLEILLAR
jgi:hypothetical protein